MKSKIFFAIIILNITIWAHSAQAINHAIFPDARSLQPMPIGIKPNISGNINFSTTENTVTNQTGNENIFQDNNLPQKTESINVAETKSSSNILYWIFGILFIISFIMIYIIKKYVEFKF